MEQNTNNEQVLECIELQDESGNIIKMDVLTPMEFSGKTYVALVPFGALSGENQEDEETDVVFVEAVLNEESGEEVLVAIEDEALLDSLFAELMAIIEAESGEDDE